MVTKNEILGRIGENLVEIELLKRNIDFWSMDYRNPSFDLIININGKLRKIQIKTSNLNNKGKFQFFLKNCVGGYDYLILVGILDKSFKKNVFYIIPEEVLSKEDIKKCVVSPQTGINIYYKNGFKYKKFQENWGYFCNKEK